MTTTLFEHLETIDDPRDGRGVRHPVAMILKLVVLGFAAKLVAIEHIVNFFRPIWKEMGPHLGSDRVYPPDPTTIRRVLEDVDRERLEQAFRNWVAQLVKDQSITASVDGKTCCNSGKEEETLKILNVFAHDIKLTLAQEDIPQGSGESTVLKRALSKLFEDYPGLSVLTGDSAFCGRSLCQAIKEAGRHYMVQVKGNQQGIHSTAKKWFEEDVKKRQADAEIVKKNPLRKIRERSGL